MTNLQKRYHRFGAKDRCGLCYCKKALQQCKDEICQKWLCSFCMEFHPTMMKGESHRGVLA